MLQYIYWYLHRKKKRRRDIHPFRERHQGKKREKKKNNGEVELY